MWNGFRSNYFDNPIIIGIFEEKIEINNGEWYCIYLVNDKNISKKFKDLWRKNVNIFEKNTGFKIKQSTLLLKRSMLKTLDMLNSYYYNDNVDYEFILNKNKMKELNEKKKLKLYFQINIMVKIILLLLILEKT